MATHEDFQVGGLPIALPSNCNILATSIASFIICFVCYYFYGGYLTICIIAITILGIAYFAQDGLLYHPELPTNSRIYVPIPTMHNLPHETITIRTPDKMTLHAFWIPQERSKTVPTFVFFHGNAGNMGHRIQNAWGMYYSLNVNILMVEYRGYGLSTGSPTERGLRIDARAAIDYLYTRHDLDHNQIILFGRSLGGAVVIDVAADAVYSQKIMCAVVENTFTSIPDMVAELIHPMFKYLPNIFYKNKYLSLMKIQKCNIPFLFIAGLADNLVPPRMTRNLFNSCGSKQKRLLEFPGGSHNDTWILDGYYVVIQEFLNLIKDIMPAQQPPQEPNVAWNGIQEV